MRGTVGYALLILAVALAPSLGAALSLEECDKERSYLRSARHVERRLGTPRKGTLRIMVLRIVALDSEPTATAQELFDLIFVNNISLKHQLYRCSFGQLDVQPVYGVLDVNINMNVQGLDRSNVIQKAYKVAPSLVDENVEDVRSLVDCVMIVVPPGTVGPWAAFGTMRGQQSVFNDIWATYADAQIHEVMHNVGLYHGYEKGVEYADVTGYMGSAIMELQSPQKCFNSQNHWFLGWFEDRSIELDVSTLAAPRLIRIAAFVDYDKLSNPNQFVLVKIGTLYLQFNRAKGMNKDSVQMRDRLTIVQEISKGTELLAGLDSVDNIFSTRSVQQFSNDLTIQVCAIAIDGKQEMVDEVIVGVGFDPLPCGGAFSTAPQTSAPYPIPTVMPESLPPSLSPSTKKPIVFLAPATDSPDTMKPTASPTFAPFPNDTDAPTQPAFAPLPKVTDAPTQHPTIAPTETKIVFTSPTPTIGPSVNPTIFQTTTTSSSHPTFIIEDQVEHAVTGDSLKEGYRSDATQVTSTALPLIVLILVVFVGFMFLFLVVMYRRRRHRNMTSEMHKNQSNTSIITTTSSAEVIYRLDDAIIEGYETLRTLTMNTEPMTKLSDNF